MTPKKQSSKSLQKLTVSDLIKKDVIEREDIKHLKGKDLTELQDYLEQKLLSSKGDERDKILKQMSPIITKETHNMLYEYNHALIWSEIRIYLVNNGSIPSVTALSESTGLSRQTVNKHMKEFKEERIYKEQQEQFEILLSSVYSVVFKLALRGDLRACKLALSHFGQNDIKSPHTYIDKQQNNFYSMFTPEIIEKLTPEQIIEIEAVIVS